MFKLPRKQKYQWQKIMIIAVSHAIPQRATFVTVWGQSIQTAVSTVMVWRQGEGALACEGRCLSQWGPCSRGSVQPTFVLLRPTLLPSPPVSDTHKHTIGQQSTLLALSSQLIRFRQSPKSTVWLHSAMYISTKFFFFLEILLLTYFIVIKCYSELDYSSAPDLPGDDRVPLYLLYKSVVPTYLFYQCFYCSVDISDVWLE